MRDRTVFWRNFRRAFAWYYFGGLAAFGLNKLYRTEVHRRQIREARMRRLRTETNQMVEQRHWSALCNLTKLMEWRVPDAGLRSRFVDHVEKWWTSAQSDGVMSENEITEKVTALMVACRALKIHTKTNGSIIEMRQWLNRHNCLTVVT